MKVVILAGGFGTRISEESYLKPKPMVEIGGQPILWHIMKYYSEFGFNDFVICLGYKQYVVKEYFAQYFLHTADITFDLANNRMENYAYLGSRPGTSYSGPAGTIDSPCVNVMADLQSDTEVTGAGLSAGAVAVNAAVTLAFQNSRNIAAIDSMNVTADGEISVHAGMTGDTETRGLGAGVGVVGVGAIVAVARNTALNNAYVDTSGRRIKGNRLYVYAGGTNPTIHGTEPFRSHTGVIVVTGSAGLAAVSVNYALAENRPTNNAEIRGSSGVLDIGNGPINIGAFGRTTALSLAANGGLGLVTANVIIAKARLNGTQNALLTSKADIFAESLSVVSDQNKGDTRSEEKKITIPTMKDRKELGLSVTPKTMADAVVYSASAGVVAAGFTTADARSDMTVTARVDAPKLVLGYRRIRPAQLPTTPC